MSYLNLAVLAVLSCTNAVLAQPGSAAVGDTYTNPIIAGDWPDPGAIYVNGSFLVATTGGGFALHRSADLSRWDAAGSVFDKESEPPRWATGDFWAPEIHRMPDGSFNVYHTARDAEGRLAIGCATGDSPTGPFRALPAPLARDTEGDGMYIDSHYFYDTASATGYLVWKHGAVTPPAETHTWLYMQPLNAAGTQLVGKRQIVLRNDLSSWEAGVVEAPWIVRPPGSAFYYLFYSAAHCCDGSGSYAVGVARSTNVTGPYEKYEKNPILASTKDPKDPKSGFDGTGHCSVIQVRERVNLEHSPPPVCSMFTFTSRRSTRVAVDAPCALLVFVSHIATGAPV
jgi:beta-xylosidase